MKIGSHNTDDEIYVIAECGNNHEGDIELAKKLIKSAANCGAHAVKFQTFIPEHYASPKDTDRIKQLNKFRLSFEQFSDLKKTADDEGITFLSTPFDLKSAEFLDTIVPAFKISSGDNQFFPLIDLVAKTGKPLILSTGILGIEEIRNLQSYIKGVWEKHSIQNVEAALLHCIVSYPAPPEQANLRAIENLQKLGTTVGYSDHTLGIDAALFSAALGARIIEKHFTIDKNYSEFRDHQISADPDEFKLLVEKLKLYQQMTGLGEKITAECEVEIAPKVRRSIIASQDIPENQVLELEHITWVRPGDGLAPGRESEVIGKSTNKALKKGDLILLENLNS